MIACGRGRAPVCRDGGGSRSDSWILFSSNWQKKREAESTAALFSLDPPLFIFPWCDRWWRVKQVTLTEHSENNQCSTKWLINIKIPSSAEPRKKHRLHCRSYAGKHLKWRCLQMFIISLVPVMKTQTSSALSLIFLIHSHAILVSFKETLHLQNVSS